MQPKSRKNGYPILGEKGAKSKCEVKQSGIKKWSRPWIGTEEWHSCEGLFSFRWLDGPIKMLRAGHDDFGVSREGYLGLPRCATDS